MKRMCLITVDDPKKDAVVSERFVPTILVNELIKLGVAINPQIRLIKKNEKNSWGIWFETTPTFAREDASQVVLRTFGRVNEFAWFFDALMEDGNPLPLKLLWHSQDVHGRFREEALKNVVSTMCDGILPYICTGYGTKGDAYILDAVVVREDAQYVKLYNKDEWFAFSTAMFTVCLEVQVTATLNNNLTKEL